MVENQWIYCNKGTYFTDCIIIDNLMEIAISLICLRFCRHVLEMKLSSRKFESRSWTCKNNIGYLQYYDVDDDVITSYNKNDTHAILVTFSMHRVYCKESS